MSRSKYKIYEEEYPYFITTSINFGLPIFSYSKAADIIIKNLLFLKDERNIRLIAYIIMENHIHTVLQGKDLEAKFGKFKSYSARKIIDLLKDHRQRIWLERLNLVKKSYKTDQDYQLWEDSFHPQQITGDEMMMQKIEYIHQNPVKRGYVDKAEHWRYSSARNYTGMEGIIPVDLYVGRGRIDCDLRKQEQGESKN